MKLEKWISHGLLLFGIGTLPFLFKRRQLTELLLVFIFVGSFSSTVGTIVVSKRKLVYPVRYLPRIFRTNILYDLLLLPLASVFYYRVTEKDTVRAIFKRALFITVPMTLIEVLLERTTHLIKYIKWSGWTTLWSLTLTFLMTRTLIGAVKHFDKEKPEAHRDQNVENADLEPH